MKFVGFFKEKKKEVCLELLETVQLQNKSWNAVFHFNSLFFGWKS